MLVGTDQSDVRFAIVRGTLQWQSSFLKRKWAKIDTHHRHSLLWHCTTGERIATRMGGLGPNTADSRYMSRKSLVNSSPVTQWSDLQKNLAIYHKIILGSS